IEDLNFTAQQLSYRPKELNANVEEFTFKDGQRFWLNNIAFHLEVDDRVASLTNVELLTRRTSINGDASLEYASMDALINKPESAFITLNIPFALDVLDLSYIQSELLENPYIKALSSAPLQGRLVSRGSLDNLKVDSFLLQWQNSHVSLDAVVTSLLETERMYMEIPNLEIESTNADIYRFLPQEELGLDLPESLKLNGSLSGGMEEGTADLNLDSSLGNLSLAGNFLYSDAISYAVDLQTHRLDLGRI